MTNIYVGNLASPIVEARLRSEFEAYGHVNQVQIGWNFAVIGMDDDRAAKRAISELNSRTTWFLREYSR